jgi:hypothetical protein
VSLVLLALLELDRGPAILVHTGGIALLIGRLLHVRGLIASHLRLRIPGMQVTIYTIIGLALANLAYALESGVRAFFWEVVAWKVGLFPPCNCKKLRMSAVLAWESGKIAARRLTGRAGIGP